MILQRVAFFLLLSLSLNFCYAAIAQGEQDKPEVDSFLPSLMQSARFMRIQPGAQEQEQPASGQSNQVQQPFDYYDAARSEDQQAQQQQRRDSSPEFSNPEFIPRAMIVRPGSNFYGRIIRYQLPSYQNGPIQSQVFLVDGGVPSYEDTPSQPGQFGTASSDNTGELPPIVRPAVEPVLPRPTVESPNDSKDVEAKVQETTPDPSLQTEKVEEPSTSNPKDLESESVDQSQSTETEAPKSEGETEAPTSEVETETPKSENTNVEATTQDSLPSTEEEPKVVDSETGEKSEEAEKTVTETVDNSETTATDAPKEAEKTETEEAQVATEAPKVAETEEVRTENKETEELNPTTSLPEAIADKLLEETTAGVENKPEEKVEQNDSSTPAPTIEETTLSESPVTES
ncbi:hypothetical protein Ddc_11283 [Ditylenchus destructor]|nr:hypothetical protein Ddc_11283 [Ditylenchus destructor]